MRWWKKNSMKLEFTKQKFNSTNLLAWELSENLKNVKKVKNLLATLSLPEREKNLHYSGEATA